MEAKTDTVNHLVKSAVCSKERSSGQQSKESTWPSWEMTIPVDPRTLLMNALPYLSRFLAHTLVAHGRPAKKHVPRLLTLIHTCRFKGYWDTIHVHAEWVCARHTLRIRTPSKWHWIVKLHLYYNSHCIIFSIVTSEGRVCNFNKLIIPWSFSSQINEKERNEMPVQYLIKHEQKERIKVRPMKCLYKSSSISNTVCSIWASI